MTLEERREQWEKGFEVKCEIKKDQWTLLVVLEEPFDKTKYNDPETIDDKYHCHRYFQIGDSWEVSVDGQRVNSDTVFAWLMEPAARTCSKLTWR